MTTHAELSNTGHFRPCVAHPFTSKRPVLSSIRPELKKVRLNVCVSAKDSSEGEPDVIERLFGAVFGSKALEASEPLGMKRMSEEAYNEQSVATTTEFAAPLQGDTAEVALIRPLLAKTRLELKPLRCSLLRHTLSFSSLDYRCHQ
jgi:hypothetical protein